MPTNHESFALVAKALDSSVIIDNKESVSKFYEFKFIKYNRKQRELIAGFLISCESSPPTSEELQCLISGINHLSR